MLCLTELTLEDSEAFLVMLFWEEEPSVIIVL